MSQPTRRTFLGKLAIGAAAGAVGCTTREPSTEPTTEPTTEIIPPTSAIEQTTACAHCIVGCGYRTYTWPVADGMGTRSADGNALGETLGSPGAPWISPEMVNRVTVDGEDHWIAVLPDWRAEVVNIGGDHTLGGSLARRLYNRAEPAQSDRLLTPQLRIDGELVSVPWDDALELLARYSSHVLAKPDGHLRFGMKTYSYQFYENTFTITRFAFDAIGTPCWTPHDRCADGSDAPGLSDAGIDVFSAAYQDWYDADVIFVSGVSLVAAHGVLFSQWVKRGGATLVVVDPRRSVAAKYAEENGGLHLQIIPGTDTALHRGLARLIVEQGWEDREWLEEWVATADELVDETKWRRVRFMRTLDEYEADLLSDPDAELQAVAAICGLAAEDIERAAELLAAPRDGARPHTSMMLEKGNYWGHNYCSTGSFASLSLLLGAGNRPGRVVSRAGGHQRGMVKAASYPIDQSPDSYESHPLALNVDRWVSEGRLELMWLIGCTWAGGGTAQAGALYEVIRGLTSTGPAVGTDVQPDGAGTAIDVEAVLDAWRARGSAGGLVLVQSDLYPQEMTKLADLVLTAAGWGEMTGTRMQGERRLRLYPQLADAPGECRPDWQVIAAVAQRMGFSGFDWPDHDALLEEALGHTGGVGAASALLDHAAALGTDVKTLLAESGTRGYQCPLSLEDGEIVETPRYHDAGAGRGFSTSSGKAMMIASAWSDVEPLQALVRPAGDELWVVNRRTSTNWSSLVEDFRVPFRTDLVPNNFLEIHPDDAASRGIEDGIEVVVEGNGGLFFAVARVTNDVRRGVSVTYFNHGGDPETAANSVVSAHTDEVMNRYLVKLGRGIVRPL